MPRELRADDHHGEAAGEPAVDRVEQLCRGVDPAAAGVAAPHVLQGVLAHAERHAPAPHRRQKREQDRQRVWPEQPDRVRLSKHAPEARERADHGRDRAARVDEARVVGEGDELHRVGQAVVGGARARIEPPHDHEPLHVRGELREEEGEGALRVEGVALAPVDVVGVDGEPHGPG